MLGSRELLQMTRDCLDAVENPDVGLDRALHRMSRLGRLLPDAKLLAWAELQITGRDGDDDIAVTLRELMPVGMSREASQQALEAAFGLFIQSRKYGPKTETGTPGYPGPFENILLDIEVRNDTIRRVAEVPRPSGDAFLIEKVVLSAQNEIRQIVQKHYTIVQRVRNQARRLLIATEAQLVFGASAEDAFHRTQRKVDAWLEAKAPEAGKGFRMAFRRGAEDDPEAWSQALLACRRVLEAVADVLYPPKDEAIIMPDGRRRSLGQDKYINRLWQFAQERLGESATGRTLEGQVEALGNRIDQLYKLSNKGVHSTVEQYELDQALLGTYLVVGELFRLSEAS